MRYLVLSLLLSMPFGVYAANKLAPEQLSGFVGKKVTVCGKVAEIATIKSDTFINLDSPHPYQKFYFYLNNQNISSNNLFKTVCGTGVLTNHKGKLQIKIADSKALTFS
ncbi:MAG: hypothetical protein GAK29_00257 [Acinetobacter bereziniae]|uniref:Uncharacterized protein n=1 Tax=Acinetobacter bereziniae TaxID=106648 RepID=A0A833PI58_ACIBZ|nr:MAG: hypothetical protein GAK29_00257 [Acinetobacter bereziniae]